MTKARDLANAGTALTSVSATELGYLDGVTSAVQTQINSKIGQATAINPTIVDAKGDIIAATAADTVARLAVGSNNTVLTADSSTATGLKWASPAGGGKILQVIQATNSTEITSTSATFADTNLTASITPSSTSSRILVMISQPYQNVVASSGNELVGNIKIQRGGTDITTQTLNFRATAYSSELQYRGTFNFHYVDSPATTSSTTYKTQYNNTGAGNFRVNNNLSTIILMEIGA